MQAIFDWAGSSEKKGGANEVSKAKNLIAYRASKKLGITSKELADYFGISRPAVSYCIKQGEIHAKHHNVNLLL